MLGNVHSLPSPALLLHLEREAAQIITFQIFDETKVAAECIAIVMARKTLVRKAAREILLKAILELITA